MTRQTDDQQPGGRDEQPGELGRPAQQSIHDHGTGFIGGHHEHYYGSKVVAPSWPVFHGLPEPAGEEVVDRLDVTEPIVDKLLHPTGTDRQDGNGQGTHGMGYGVVGVSTTAALRGAGGFGKTTAARIVVHDHRVREGFRDGIVWLQAGRDVDDARLVAGLNDAVRAVKGTATGYQRVQSAAAELGQALAGRRMLVVLDDAWTPEHMDMLTALPGSVMRLVTTRQPGLLPTGSHQVAVDEMTPAQARAALTTGLPQTSFTTDRAVHAVIAAMTATGRWPILLSLLNALLRDAHRNGQDEVAVLERHLDRLRERGVRALDRTAERERRSALSVLIEGNLDQLGSDRDLFTSLAVFPEDHQIPIPVLHRYWTHLGQEHAEREGGGMRGIFDMEDTREVCARFADHCLTTDADLHPVPDLEHIEGGPQLDGGWIRIHDVIRDYLTHTHPPQALVRRHADLVAAHRGLAPTDGDGCTLWARLPRTQTYWWNQLGYHLHRAGPPGNQELAATLRDPAYLIAALQTTGPAVLEENLVATASAAEDSEDLVSLAGVVRRNTVLARTCETDQMMTATLESRTRNRLALAPLHQQLRGLLTAPTLELLDPVPDLSHDCLRRTLTGHTSAVDAVAIAPDGSYLVTASRDGTARVWDPSTGVCTRILSGHTSAVTAVAIAPDGSYLVTASGDKTARVWDPSTGVCTRTLTGHTSFVNAVAIARDGSYVVTAGPDGAARVWDPASGDCTRILSGHTSDVVAVAIAPDGSYLVTGSWDGTARIWDPASGDCTRILDLHTSAVDAVAIAPDGSYLITTSNDGTARIWDPASGDCTRILDLHTSAVDAVAIAPDGSYLITASWDKTARVWDPSTGECTRILSGHTSAVTAVAIAGDGSYLITASWDKTARVWDPASGDCTHTLDGHTSAVTAVAIAGDGSYLVTASWDGTARVWDPSTGACTHTLTGHTGYVVAVAIAPDSRYLVTASWDGTARVWDPSTGACTHTLTGHASRVTVVAIAGDGSYLVTISADRTARVWDPNTGACTHILSGHASFVVAVAIAGDGSYLVTASGDGTARVWDPNTGACTHILSGHASLVAAVAIAGDGSYLVTASGDGTARVWDPATGACTHILSGHASLVAAVAIAPDGSYLVTASDDGTARVWDPNTGACTHILSGHASAVAAVAIAPDGSYLVTTSDDGTARVWDPNTGACTHILSGHASVVAAVAIAPDGSYLVTTSDDGTVRVWSVEGHQIAGIRVDAGLQALALGGDGLVAASGDRHLYRFRLRSTDVLEGVSLAQP